MKTFKNPEINRKLLHLLFAAYPVLLVFCQNNFGTARLINFIFCFVIIGGDFVLRFALKHSALQKVFYRNSELSGTKKISGGVWIAISCLVLVSFFYASPQIYTPPLLMIAFCDTLSSFIGKNFGRRKTLSTNKTIEGFAGFLLGGVPVYLVLILLSVHIAIPSFIFMLIFCALAELFIKIDDNISISIAYLISYGLVNFF